MERLVIFAALLLAGCGSAEQIKPAPGQALPPKPYGASETPTPKQLLAPSTQARPQRNDELLKDSEKRQPDPFDLPPQS